MKEVKDPNFIALLTVGIISALFALVVTSYHYKNLEYTEKFPPSYWKWHDVSSLNDTTGNVILVPFDLELGDTVYTSKRDTFILTN